MSTHESTQKKHASFGDKIKGAAHVVHGLGEDVRGTMMGAFESAEEAKGKDNDIATKGRSEIEQGIAQMKGTEAPGGTASAPESHAEGKPSDKPQEKPTEAATTKEAAVPASTTSAPESRTEGNTGDQPQVQPTKDVPPHGAAVPGITSAGPAPQVEGKTGDQPQEKPSKEAPGPTPAPPPSPIQSRQTEPETRRQESIGQTSPDNAQKSSQETQASSSVPIFLTYMHTHTSLASETKSSQKGESVTGRDADVPQGLGGNI
ncbi:hypothetical protein OG21DRAFT_1524226 [Imleria badia]|nr:hypothetical protein OG21DRAFT_1524226 [Imleria badia]